MSKIFYSKRTQKRAAALGPKNFGKHAQIIVSDKLNDSL